MVIDHLTIWTYTECLKQLVTNTTPRALNLQKLKMLLIGAINFSLVNTQPAEKGGTTSNADAQGT